MVEKEALMFESVGGLGTPLPIAHGGAGGQGVCVTPATSFAAVIMIATLAWRPAHKVAAVALTNRAHINM